MTQSWKIVGVAAGVLFASVTCAGSGRAGSTPVRASASGGRAGFRPAALPVVVQAATRSTEENGDSDTHVLKIMGMTCPNRCVQEVREQLLAVPGVLDVVIDTNARKATVRVARGTDPELLVAGLRAPYSGRLM